MSRVCIWPTKKEGYSLCSVFPSWNRESDAGEEVVADVGVGSTTADLETALPQLPPKEVCKRHRITLWAFLEQPL